MTNPVNYVQTVYISIISVSALSKMTGHSVLLCDKSLILIKTKEQYSANIQMQECFDSFANMNRSNSVD